MLMQFSVWIDNFNGDNPGCVVFQKILQRKQSMIQPEQRDILLRPRENFTKRYRVSRMYTSTTSSLVSQGASPTYV